MNRSDALKILSVVALVPSLAIPGYIFASRYVAKRDLENLGITFSQEAFVKAACARNKEVAALFVKSGMDVNARGRRTWTPLHCAAEVGDVDTLSALLDRNADVNARIEDPAEALITPLHLAASNGKSDIAMMLLDAGADVNANSPWGSPLFLAAAKGDDEMVKFLIARGADIRLTDRWGQTALHAVFRRSASESVAETLLKSGVDVNAEGRNGDTALHLAVLPPRKTGLVEKLIAHGANVNAASENGTPLFNLLMMPGHSRTFDIVPLKLSGVVRLLLDKGADPNIPDSKNNTPLVAAALGGDLAVVEALLDAGAKVNTTSDEWGTPLHAAVRSGNREIADLLVRHGADVNALDCCSGKSVLHTAVQMTGPDTEQLVLLLLGWGAFVDARSQGGVTPLMDANNAKLSVVRALVEHGANVNAKMVSGHSVLSRFRARNSEAVAYLISKGAVD